MNSIYIILLAIFIFKFGRAINTDTGGYKRLFVKGLLVIISLLCLLASIIVHIVEVF